MSKIDPISHKTSGMPAIKKKKKKRKANVRKAIKRKRQGVGGRDGITGVWKKQKE